MTIPTNTSIAVLCMSVRLSPTIVTQNTRPICPLDSARSRRERIPKFGYASFDIQSGSSLLEAIGIVLETHFGFGFSNESPIGDIGCCTVLPTGRK